MVNFDARCHACDSVHIVHVGENQEEGDEIEYAHNTGWKACGEYAKHTLLRKLRHPSDGIRKDSTA